METVEGWKEKGNGKCLWLYRTSILPFSLFKQIVHICNVKHLETAQVYTDFLFLFFRYQVTDVQYATNGAQDWNSIQNPVKAENKQGVSEPSDTIIFYGKIKTYLLCAGCCQMYLVIQCSANFSTVWLWLFTTKKKVVIVQEI